MLRLSTDSVPFTELTRQLIEGNNLTTRPASYAEGLRALELARLAAANDARHRMACYELSLTAAFYCIANRLSIDWCLGISFDLDEPHAWLEANGKPICGEADEIIEGVYQRVLRVASSITA